MTGLDLNLALSGSRADDLSLQETWNGQEGVCGVITGSECLHFALKGNLKAREGSGLSQGSVVVGGGQGPAWCS